MRWAATAAAPSLQARARGPRAAVRCSDHWKKNIAVLGLKCRTYSLDLLGYGWSDKPDPRCAGAGRPSAPACARLGRAQHSAGVLHRRLFPRNELYCFETWAAQVLGFVREVVGAPAFLICNSVGGAARRGVAAAGAPDGAGAGGVTRAPARRAGIVGLQAAVDAGPGAVAGVQLLDVSLRMLHVTKQAPWQRPLVAALQLLLRDTPLGTWFFSSVARPQARARAPAGARQRQGRRGPASARVLARRR